MNIHDFRGRLIPLNWLWRASVKDQRPFRQVSGVEPMPLIPKGLILFEN